MSTGRELAGLFAPAPAESDLPMHYRQGVIVEWNPITAENTVRVDGALFTDLPMLNTSEALLLVPGDVVGVVSIGSSAATSWFIAGRVAIPGSAAAASTLNMLRIGSSSVSAGESTTTTTFTDLTTTGPVVTDVLVGGTGRCLVIVSAQLTAQALDGAQMDFDAAGPTSSSADVSRALIYAPSGPAGNAGVIAASRTTLLTGLTAGYYTFTAKYRSVFGATATFANRNVTAVPL